MRVAALYDVHGNLPALEAVLAEFERESVDVILAGGDVAAGPMPAETLARLDAAGAIHVRGNADRWFLDVWEGRVRPDLAEEKWLVAQVGTSYREFLGKLPLTTTVDVEGLGAVLFCHGSPRSEDEIVTAITPPERLRPMLEAVEEDVVVCGHTHVQFDRRVDGVRVVNAGSVGMPYEAEPGAYWAVLGPDVELRRTAYDLEAAAARILATGWPEADDFVRENLLTVPSRAEALAAFEPRVG